MASEGVEDNDDDDEIHISQSTLGLPIKSIPQTTTTTQAENDITHTITISAIAPRSKFTLEMFERGCVFTNNKSEQISIPCHSVKHIIMFPKREDCMKLPKRIKPKNKTDENMDVVTLPLPGSMVLIVFQENKVTFRQKALAQICFQLPQHQSDPLDIPPTTDDGDELSHLEFRNLIKDSYECQWAKILKSSLDVDNVARVYNPKLHQDVPMTFQFQSDKGDKNTRLVQGGMPFVKCYSGACCF